MLNKNKIVLKFGGTSIGTPTSFLNIPKIINNYSEDLIIVLSAQKGVTQLLINLINLLEKDLNNNVNYLINEIEELHLGFVRKLVDYGEIKSFINYKKIIKNKLNELIKIIDSIRIVDDLSQNSKNRILFIGESLSCEISNEYLNDIGIKTGLINSTELIKKEEDYIINENILLKGWVNQRVLLTQGFIVSGLNDSFVNLGRGGSDYSASILANKLEAKSLDIYTDVDGVYSADPNLVKDAFILENLSFDEMKIMARYGAKVLHPEAILPAIIKEIDVRILNTFNINSKGSKISIESPSIGFKAVTLKKDLIKISFSTDVKSLSDVIQLIEQQESLIYQVIQEDEITSIICDKVNIEIINDFIKIVKNDVSLLCFIGNDKLKFFEFIKGIKFNVETYLNSNLSKYILIFPHNKAELYYNSAHQLLL